MKSEIITAIGLIVLGFAAVGFGTESNFQELMAAGKTASQKGEIDKALADFNAAFQAAPTPGSREEAGYVRNQFLLQNRK